MYKQRIVLFTVLCFFFTISDFFSQISNLTPTVGGCVPYSTTYAAPPGATQHSWNFGDTPNITTSGSGSHNYTTPGTFSCQYSGIVGGSPVNFTVVVYVYPKPVALFSITQPANSCIVKSVTLTNQSTSSSPLASWLWTYGDGGSASFNNGNPHTYNYTLAGNYTVSLKVTDIYSCETTTTVGTVSVFPTATAVIVSNPSNLSACFPPFSASFASGVAAPVGATFAWNFGNSQTSTQQNPPNSVNYPNAGSYTVSLSITANGCSSTHTRIVSVNPPSLVAAAPPTVCLNAPFTVTLQSNQLYTSWDLGGNNVTFVPSSPVSLQQTVNIGFTSTGLKTITVTAGNAPCVSTSLITVYVEEMLADFVSPPPDNSCSSPFLVNLQSTSVPAATSFTWIIPTAQHDTITYLSLGGNPIFTYTQGSLNQYTNYNSVYNPAYAPTVTMIAMSAAGCKGSAIHTFDSITRPAASFYKSKQDGCAPLTSTFTNNSFVFPFNPITSYTWCNGATPPVFVAGTASNVVFTYTATGTYTPYLIIQTASGCTDVSFIDTITVSNPPVISFNFSPQTVCHDQPVQIINTTAPNVMSTIDHWHVESDAGYFSGCISDPNPQWHFTHMGVHGFTMSAYVHGCKQTVVSSQSVTVLGPFVQARYVTNCTNRYSVDFYSSLQAAPNATLDFDDNTPKHIITGNTSGSDIVNHVYAASGDYIVKLTGANPNTGCSISTYTMLVTVRNVTAALSGPTVTCLNAFTTFTAVASQDVFTGCSRGYVWYVDNLPPIDNTSPFHLATFNNPGNHTVRVVVKDINSCTDEATFNIRVSSATPQFSITTPVICINGSVQAVNTSSTTAPDQLVNFTWSFETGQTLQTNILTSPTYTYNSANVPYSIFNAVLTVSNNLGCVASVQHTVQVVKPNASFYPSVNNFCIGASPTTVTFIAQGANASYTMSYGAGPSSTLITTSNTSAFAYSLAGTYYVTLKAKDANQCESTSAPLMLVAEKTPVANFTVTSPKSNGANVICAPNSVSFTSIPDPGSSPITNYSWNLGSGSSVLSLPSVALFYQNTTNSTVVVSLMVQTGLGCTSVQTKTISLYTPTANIVASATTVCLGETIKFNIKDTTNRGILAWNWDFGNNNVTDTVYSGMSPPSFTLQPFSVYNQPGGEVPVNLIYYSSKFGCKDFVTLNVRVIKISADFKRNAEMVKQDSVHCIHLPDVFYNVSTSSLTAPPSWSFGDGATSSSANPNHTFQQSGVYQVSLTVTGEQGCKALSKKSMTVNPLPVAAITSKDSVCRDAPFELSGAGTTTSGITDYEWTPANHVNGQGSSTTIAMASVSSDFSLVVTDGNGCKSLPKGWHVYVQQPAPTLQWDTTVIVGQPVPVNGNVGPDFSYTWTPIADLSCIKCSYPISSSTVNVTYSVDVQDNMKCFVVTNTYTIYIDPETSVDVPTAFTPNGDGTNDIIYVDGWGISKLNFFRVYNRWGQLLFESNDIKTGWDGTYKGVPQNMETYVYQVSVETFTDKKGLTKTSSFRLIR